jgi:hypothetical protein
MARHSDLMAGIRMGDLAVSLIASGTPYSPDVADDLARRCLDLWNGTLDAMDEFSMLDNGACDPEQDDEEYGPTPNKELQTPHIVRFMEQWGEEDA